MNPLAAAVPGGGGAGDSPTPNVIRALVVCLSFYLAAPLWDLPLLGLSLSALLIFFLFFETFRHLGGLGLRRLGMLPWLLIVLWFGQLFSLAVNEIFDDQSINFAVGLTTLFRYAFWFLVACLSARIFSVTRLARTGTIAFGIGCLSLTAVFLGEHFLLGGLKETGWSNITVLSQNSYGWQYSAFLPSVLYLVFQAKGKWKLLSGIGLAAALLAVLLNGSRSSWATAIVGLLLFSFLWTVSSRGIGKAVRAIVLLGLALVVTSGLFIVAPESVKERFFIKIERSQDLSRDKSWQIRLLMVQKGERLFFDNLLFGVGPGQFRYVKADLDIPMPLSYQSEDYFNTKSSHNSYIQLLAEGGLALAVPFVSMLLWLVITGGRAAVFLARHGERWLIPVYVGFVCFSIHFWSVAGVTSTAPWLLYGMLTAGILRARKLGRTSVRLNHEVRHGDTPGFSLSHPR